MQNFIPVNEPLLDGNEKAYLAECIESGWISSEGPFVERFEAALAARVGRRHGIAVSSGTAALEVTVAALGIGAGDEVILPTFTIISCALAVVRAGATPVLVDCDPLTWNLDPGAIEERVSSRTRAIMPVHIYGLPVDMDPLLRLAKRHGLAIIEDASQALGQTYRGRPCGSFGNLGTFSFYPNKLVTTGEGGMIVTDDDQLAARCRSLRNLCFQPQRRFVHEEWGWNYRMSNLNAAVGLAQFEQLDRHISIKRKIGRRYQALLGAVADIQRPLAQTADAENLYWVFGLVLGKEHPLNAAAAMAALRPLGVDTRPFFWPLHQQPVLLRGDILGAKRSGTSDEQTVSQALSDACLPVSERIAERGFYLPSGLTLTEGEAARVVAALLQVLAIG